MAKNIEKNMLLSGASWLILAVAAFIAAPITLRGCGVNVHGVVAPANALAGQELLQAPLAPLQQSVVAFRLGDAAFGLGMIVALLSLVPSPSRASARPRST